NNNVWELQFPVQQCNSWVKTGIHCRVPLLSSGQFTTLESHAGSKSCSSFDSRQVIQNTHISMSLSFPQPPNLNT
ncbi:hypothetical protein PAXRUDRAFT_149529, partial [Paxillus rubicundulus Ve08.2h10]